MPRSSTVVATKIQFPAQIVLLIVGSAVSATCAVWATQSTMRSDVRDIKTRMELQASVDNERQSNLRESIESMKRRQELQQFELSALKEVVISVRNNQPK